MRLRGDAVVDALRAVLTDDTFARRFEVGVEVGEGGMGRVHRALDRATGQPIALKVLHASGVESRFTLEAETLERMDHPAIVAYVGHGVTTTGDAYLAMAWLEGESLATRLTREPVSIADTLAIGIRIASALAHAHGHAIVHRDLKPANVMLVGRAPDQAMLIDFGIAKDTAVTHGLTETGQLIGTPGYMAPEQAMGDAAPASAMDLFGLGAVLYECLAGRPPFEGTQAMQVLAQVLLRDPDPVRDVRPEVPVRLAALVTALLEKEPERRTATAIQVERELREIASALGRGDTQALAEIPAWIPSVEVRATVSEKRRPAPPRDRTVLVAALALVALLGVVGVAVALRGEDAPATPLPPTATPLPPTSPTPTPPTTVHACETTGAGACQRACEASDAPACRVAGRASYLASDGDDVAQHAALALLTRGCTLGDASACNLAGTWTRRHAAHGDAHVSRAAWVALFERGCTLAEGTSCALLAGHLLAESPTHQSRALALYERGCAVNNLASCVHAADILRHRDGAGDQDRARALLADACTRGYVRACKR